MPSLSYLKQFWSLRFEKANPIDHLFSIRLGVNSIFLFHSSAAEYSRVTNQFDILNVQVEWS